MEYKSRKIVMPADLNGNQTLFGGKALAWIDEESAIYAACQLNTANIVTKAMSNINFIHPAHIGDIIEIGTKLVRVGRTSITVKCTMRNKTTAQEIITVDEITFVHIDHDGKPTPHNVRYGT